MQFLGLGNLFSKLIQFLIYVVEDTFFTLFKYTLGGFAHWTMDTFKYLVDFVLHIIRLFKR